MIVSDDTDPDEAPTSPMKPVLILQHMSADSPAYLATWLRAQGLAFDVRDSQAGDAVPEDLADFAALALLGGEMNANDPLPALRHSEVLIRQGVQRGVPVIGHCLGGQLMARALGARVVDSPAPEIGWHPIQIAANAVARAWLGDAAVAEVFQWHYDAFELPEGATLLASSAACPRQAFSIGRHIALQFHVELDDAKLRRWAEDDDARREQASRRCDTVHAGAAMRLDMSTRLLRQQRMADHLYRRWMAGAPQ